MGYWDYKHIGASANRENKKHVEKIFDYIGYGRELDYSDGEECSFREPEVYRCVSSDNPSVDSEIDIKAAFQCFDETDLLNLLNALFPGTDVYVHSAEGNNTSDTWENHDEVYDASSMTLKCSDSYTDYGGDGPTGERSWKERFALKPPEMKYVTALIELSTADGNTELTALLEELAQKLRDGLIVYEDDGSDDRVIGQRYDVDDNVYGEEEEDKENWDDKNGEEDDQDEDDNEDNEDFEYDLLEDGTAEITGYCGKSKTLEIPKMLDDHIVTAIGDQAFSSCDSLTSVTIPDSVAEMGTNPLMCCEKLADIRVSPDHPYLAVIDGVLFSKPDKRLVCYPYAFTAETYTIPTGIRVIGDEAFSGCYRLTTVTIPDSVTAIGDRAFVWCSSLTGVTIPGSVTAIGDQAFDFCHDELVITTPAGSYAEKFAEMHDISVKNI